MRVDIVIGANLGDEGKGLITDFYASQSKRNALVVRHNSGPQAGHTVTLSDGRRHVFGHIGAGTFAGAATYLSRHFVCNPLLFRKEYLALQKKTYISNIYVDVRSLVTTPYDMMINQISEEHRANKRHGSCGVGFGETIERNTHPQFSLCVNDLNNLSLFIEKLVTIRMQWLPKRLLALGINKVPDAWIERIESNDILSDYIDATSFFLRTTKPCTGLPLKSNTHVIFEGAQGLLLDQDHEWFPHVTRSYTGIRNALDILQEAGVHQASATYVTRSYLTRHGAGPLPFELKSKPYDGIVDDTNHTNTFQGHLRFAWLDSNRVSNAIQKDLEFVPNHMKIDTTLAITCMDQLPEKAFLVQEGKLQEVNQGQFIELLYQKVSPHFLLTSYGPTRSTIRSQGEAYDRENTACIAR